MDYGKKVEMNRTSKVETIGCNDVTMMINGYSKYVDVDICHIDPYVDTHTMNFSGLKELKELRDFLNSVIETAEKEGIK